MQIVLEKITATAGFLEKASIEFGHGLNCIIGARGTCKSTLIESVRFAFNSDPERIEVLLGKRHEGHLTGIVKETLAGGTVRCLASDLRSDTTYVIEREVYSEPRIYREGVKDLTDPAVLHRIEIYSQGDLQRIAEDEVLRLKLIDRPNLAQIGHVKKQQQEIAQRLREIGPKIRDNKGRAEFIRSQIRVLPELYGQLDEVRASRPQLSRELDDLRELYLRRKKAINAFQSIAEAADRGLQIILKADESVTSIESALLEIEKQELPEAQQIHYVITEFHGKLNSILITASGLQTSTLTRAYEEFTRKVDELNEPYYELRKQEMEANESLKVEDELKRQIEHLEREKKELAIIEEQLDSLIGERTVLRQRLKKLADEVFQLRQTEVNAINERHAHLVILTLDHNSLSSEYFENVQQLLQGSRLRGQDEIAREIATKLTPEDLVDLVEAGDTRKLAMILARDQVQMTRLMSFLIDSPGIYELEGHVFEDRLNITMYDDGQPKPVQTLSKGQKATALLPLILREAPYPLVFDQPEDDLDNRFIFNSLVQTIRELKQKRQIIFVTHNANIPVIGEAETVIVMKMDTPKRAAPPLIGSVNERQQEIIDLLEGGAEAFRERERRYHELLTLKSFSNAE